MAQSKKRRTWIAYIVVFAVASAGGAWWYLGRDSGAAAPAYRTAKIDRGTVASTVSSSGTLRALVTVEVGTQVSGQIKELLADFNTEVKAGQVIARIDPAIFEAKVREAEAELATFKANVLMQKARLDNARAESKRAKSALDQAKLDLDRNRELFEKKVASQAQYDRAGSTHEQAEAALSALAAKEAEQHAQIEYAEAQVLQKSAALARAKIDLENTYIRSPVDGVVIGRNVDMGQTVAASLQSPILFVIAQNLRQMQVEVNVDEADIGRIQERQVATFTVDSFPGISFPGVVRQVRKLPKDVSNVVTYTVVVSAENPQLRLLPGMTANVTFDIVRRDNVLRVPNAALRFRPAGEPGSAAAATPPAGGNPSAGPGAGNARQRAEEFVNQLKSEVGIDKDQEEQVRAIFAEMGRRFQQMRADGADQEQIREEMAKLRAQIPDKVRAILRPDQLAKFNAFVARSSDAPRRGAVYVVGESGAAKRVDVQLGVADGSFTELTGDGLKAGDQVIVGFDTSKKAAAPASRGPRFGF